MIQINNRALCTGCHACYSSCPSHCITMKPDDEGFLYPYVEASLCINCGKCEKSCPILSQQTGNSKAMQIGYAAFNTNEFERRNSSSGGVFSLLANTVLANGGVVVGAAFANNNKTVHHVLISVKEDLDLLRSSKYTQSTLGDVLSQTESILKEGRQVLFTGTPCQIGGLYSFLGKDYSNLYTQDLICHGVPSPSIWKKYVDYREQSSGALSESICFRNKSRSWKNYEFVIHFNNNSEYRRFFADDAFMKGFLKDIYLRPSCYSCPFRGTHRLSDLTLADFWGIQKVLPEMDDDKGTSFVWIHSKKGEELFNSVKGNLVYKDVSCDEAIKYNPSAISNSKEPPKRRAFFTDVSKVDFEILVSQYSRQTYKEKVRSVFRKIKIIQSR